MEGKSRIDGLSAYSWSRGARLTQHLSWKDGVQEYTMDNGYIGVWRRCMKGHGRRKNGRQEGLTMDGMT